MQTEVDVLSCMLFQVLTLAKSMNGLWSAEGRSKLHPDFAKVLEMQEAERNNMCEVGNREENRETKTKTPLSRMQGRNSGQSWAELQHCREVA